MYGFSETTIDSGEQKADVKENSEQKVEEVESTDAEDYPSPYENSEMPDNKMKEEKESNEDSYEANTVINENGERFRTDDNGNRYMDYNKEEGKWELKPSSSYEVNGYKYETDDQGRIEHVEGQLYLKDGDRSALNAQVEDMKEGDDRGHIVADRFNGSNRIDNLVPQLSEVNRGEYKALENELADAVSEGKSVSADYELYYEDEKDIGSKRPSEITVNYTIDGVTRSRTFENE